MRLYEGPLLCHQACHLAEFKTEIINIFEEIDVAVFELVSRNFWTHLEEDIETNCGHIENVLH